MTEARPSPFASATLWIALVLGIGFLASFLLGEDVAKSHQVEGGGLHAVLGLVTAALAVWHALHHRIWLGSVFRLGVKLGKGQGLRRVAIAVLGVTSVLMIVTGVLCSRVLGMDPSRGVIGLHHLTTKLTLLVVIWHLVLVRRQIAHWFMRRKATATDAPKDVDLAS